MKNHIEICNRCIKKLNSIDIFPQEISEVAVNTRAKRLWGRATRKKDGTYKIEISERLLADNVPDWPAYSTMYHELLHCVNGCDGHKGKWKDLAQKCNRELGTNITRCSDYSSVIPEIPHNHEPKYVFRCTKCGNIVAREKRSKFVRLYKAYICGRCGGTFERVK